MTTAKPLDFYPERVTPDSAEWYTYLAGRSFVVPAGAEVELVTTVNGRRLVQLKSGGPGFRFISPGELEVPKEDLS